LLTASLAPPLLLLLLLLPLPLLAPSPSSSVLSSWRMNASRAATCSAASCRVQRAK
jgi:hypothetical protein